MFATKNRARTEASLVAARHENPPLLGGGRLSLDWGEESLVPVLQGQGLDVLGLDTLALGLALRVRRRGSGSLLEGGLRGLGAEAAEEVLELGLVLIKRAFSGGGQQGQREEGSCRESHLDGVCARAMRRGVGKGGLKKKDWSYDPFFLELVKKQVIKGQGKGAEMRGLQDSR